ncbi:MAG: biosynthetic-type acetolactate synthase large subunit [Candidatus Poribacteria bacterium]|nr:biosynthetic-type acetolactate synthase large subunit [Candidatus Poribacteria bacterium]
MKLKGCEILIKSLKREGVDLLFGYSGGAALHIFDALYKFNAANPDDPVRLVMARHEQGATHAADGYARVTGKAGVTLVTSGPGATNCVTGIATAQMDSIPMVVICGQVPSGLIGNDAFQETDVIGVTRPIVKHSYLIHDVNDVARIVREAFHIAESGRPGPVVIDFPKDIQVDETEFTTPDTVDIRGYKPKLEGHPKQIQKAAELIMKAERPFMYGGGGIVLGDASDEFRELVWKTQIPTTVTLMGLGAFPETDPLALKMPGMHGSRAANYAFQECDLIIAIGARFDDRVTGNLERFAPLAKIIHIDIDPSAISKNVHVDVPIVGHVKNILPKLTELVDKTSIEPWRNQCWAWKEKYPFTYQPKPGVVMPQQLIEEIWNLTRGEAILTSDVGQHQMWCGQHYQHIEPRRWLNSGGLGTMGYGLPAAMGAQFAHPDALVVCVSGDGGIIMNIQELTTIASHKLPVKTIVMNNNWLGMVRQWQELLYEERYSASDLHDNPDFAKVAEAFGVRGMTVKDPEELRPALEEAFAYDGPALLDVLVDETENVYPMVPAGAALDEMIGGIA